MVAKLDPIAELKKDHQKVRDYLLSFIDALGRQDAQKSLEILISLDRLGGPHFRFEEEAFYPALEKFFGREYLDYLFKAHDRVIGAAKGIAEILGKGSLSSEESRKLVSIVRSEILPHPIECEGLVLLAERLPRDDMKRIADSIVAARKADVPLLEWADTIRGRSVWRLRRHSAKAQHD